MPEGHGVTGDDDGLRNSERIDRAETVVVEPAAEEDLADGDALLARLVDADHDIAGQAVDLVLAVTKEHGADGR